MDTTADELMQRVRQTNNHFKKLLDLIPPQSYFSQEEKDEIFGNDMSDDYVVKTKHKKHKGKGKRNPFTTLSVTQITEMRQKGEPLVAKTGPNQAVVKQATADDSDEMDKVDSIDAKHQSKKQSRSSKGKKKSKGKELQRRESRLQELQDKLRVKLEEMKARKSTGQNVNSQEQKKLKRQEKKVNSKLKNKNNTHKGSQKPNLAEGLRSPPHKKILNENGEPVKSKFDFSIISMGNDRSKSSDLKGRDYKRLLEKVEKRKQKVDDLRQKDSDAADKLEQKIMWQTIMSKAQGEKVKDDERMLRKAAKRKEKVKEKKQKKWGDRVKTVDNLKQKKQEKREKNIEKRKTDKKDKKRKKMIKKGRIIPGF